MVFSAMSAGQRIGGGVICTDVNTAPGDSRGIGIAGQLWLAPIAEEADGLSEFPNLRSYMLTGVC